MSTRMRSVLIRTGVLLAVLFIAFLASGVILAQSSQDFDLGCRAELTAGGYSAAYPGVGVRLQSSVGQWGAGRATMQGSGIVLQSGYILPVGQPHTAAVAGTSETYDDDAIAVESLYIPAVYSVQFIRFVRPCNWGWTSAAQGNQ